MSTALKTAGTCRASCLVITLLDMGDGMEVEAEREYNTTNLLFELVGLHADRNKSFC